MHNFSENCIITGLKRRQKPNTRETLSPHNSLKAHGAQATLKYCVPYANGVISLMGVT